MIGGVLGFAAFAAFSPQLFRPLSSIVFYTMPAEVSNFMNLIQPGPFFGIALSGQWWLPIFHLCIPMFLNIFGEELRTNICADQHLCGTTAIPSGVDRRVH